MTIKSVLDTTAMNAELHTLLWYARTEIVLTRRRNVPVSNKIMFNKQSHTPEENMNKEVYELMGDIMNTLDDILGAETMLWNAILLSNIITAFTTHLSNFKQCHNASHSLGSTTLSLNNNYIRIKCHIETILDVLKANIISLCSSVPVYGVRRSSLLESPAYKRNTTAIAVGNNTPVCPQGLKRSTRMRNIGDMNNMCVDTTKKTLIRPPNEQTLSIHTKPTKAQCTRDVSQTHRLRRTASQPHTPTRTDVVKDIIKQHGRRRLKLGSKMLIDVHNTANDAMLYSITDGEVPVQYNNQTLNEKFGDHHPLGRSRSEYHLSRTKTIIC